HLEAADDEGARRLADEVLGAHPDAPRALSLRARLRGRRGDHSAAIADSSRAEERTALHDHERAAADADHALALGATGAVELRAALALARAQVHWGYL